MKTALSCMAIVGLCEFRVKFLPKTWHTANAGQTSAGSAGGGQRGGTWSYVEATSCLVPEEGGQGEGAGERRRSHWVLTAFQDLLPTDSRLGCPPCTEVQGNGSVVPTRWPPLT